MEMLVAMDSLISGGSGVNAIAWRNQTIQSIVSTIAYVYVCIQAEHSANFGRTLSALSVHSVCVSSVCLSQEDSEPQLSPKFASESETQIIVIRPS